MTRSVLTVLVIFVNLIVSANFQNFNTPSSDEEVDDQEKRTNPGLFPTIFDVASISSIWSNATCGTQSPEVYCKMTEMQKTNPQCGICDARNHDVSKKHPIISVLDDSSSWWQSPTLEQGDQYHWVTIKVDLKQEYFIWNLIIKCGISPRPASWILDKSVDDENYEPWQYFAPDEDECWERYNHPGTSDNFPVNTSDTEVVCSTYFSKLWPFEGGEIHTYVAKGRPGSASNALTTKELKEFARARYVRLRFQKLNTAIDRLTEQQQQHSAAESTSMRQRLFYSIRFLSIIGQCICNGHAKKCRPTDSDPLPKCKCRHYTDGPNCQVCKALYNQRPWREGSLNDASPCEKCQCFGHANSCYYDEEVALNNRSLNIKGRYVGGGVCENCAKNTAGINCEKCKPGWYRPNGVSPDAEIPCFPCNCNPIGSTGICMHDNSHAADGKVAGSCECLKGYAGIKCNKCAPGHFDFPDCKICPCDIRGTKPTEHCEVHCECKEHVTGELCDECKPGYFGIAEENGVGCKQCYCSGVSTRCHEAKGYVKETIQDLKGWQIIYLETESIKEAEIDPETNILTYLVDNQEPGDFFWLAPSVYCGKKLTSYGTRLQFTVLWNVIRGDITGKAIWNPDIVIIGKNGLKIAYGQNIYNDTNNASLSVSLSEEGWYWFSNENNDDFGKKVQRNVTREQIMSVLTDIKYLLVRAKFHTTQTETGLLASHMDVGMKESASDADEIKGIEKCDCPAGYEGTSCEYCSYGYAAAPSSVSGQYLLCLKCDCNNHSASCDIKTKQCGVCEHNTSGEKCELCVSGFYGNAEEGTPDDCKPCACPLLTPSNNFSPTCIANGSSSQDYFCDNCPIGHAGSHCELCADGFYGDPLVNGSKCLPCDCNGNMCDVKTGKCLECHGNTEGVRCDKCKFGYYGDPLLRDCKECNCNPLGSVNTMTCDLKTGQCLCKSNYTGRKCDTCLDGLGNVTAGCIPCACNLLGSVNSKCDSTTGECLCKNGVVSPFCDHCYVDYYGFNSGKGCKSCSCNEMGSLSGTCDYETGQCICKPHVTGRACNTCEDKFWNLNSTDGCIPCECNHTGSLVSSCDINSGQCFCKSGVVGRTCDRCLEKFYGFSKFGCFECDKCDEPGHICDDKNGRCVCPPFTEGSSCDICSPNSWNYTPLIGCQECQCSKAGSINNMCNSITGNCPCRTGYFGRNCDSCAPGYHGWPKCRPCSCNKAGAIPDTCLNDTCLCEESGQCYCKANVVGKKCDRCRDGTFSLHVENKDGCISCFCFGRSDFCTDARLAVSQIRLTSPRQLTVRYDSNDTLYNFTVTDIFPIDPQEICYTSLVFQEESEAGRIVFNAGDSHLNITNNLRVIPGDTENVEIGVNYLFDTPLYWKLPKLFLGDKILSYGGFVQFTTETEGNKIPFPPAVLSSYPLMQLQGNGRFVLEYFPQNSSLENGNSYKIRLHESLWKIKNNIGPTLTREMMMLTLQNLQHVLIRATDSVNFSMARLRDVTMDVAVVLPLESQQLMPSMHGLEFCQCPPQYSGPSCQNPNIGFYRSYDNRTVSATVIIQVMGDVLPCNCNNRSSVCDKETGFCKNCTDNTGGHYCNECAEGFYNDSKTESKCIACPCPTAEKNFARTCRLDNNQQVYCICKPGYTGQRCDRCSKGWYGYPQIKNGSCTPCTCNPYGSLNNECHPETGQCICKEDIYGNDCSICKHRQILTSRGCTPCTDECIKLLLDDIDSMETRLKIETNDIISGKLKPPWQLLYSINNNIVPLKDLFNEYIKINGAILNSTSSIDNLKNELIFLFNKAKNAITTSRNKSGDVAVLSHAINSNSREIDQIDQQLHDLIRNLEYYIRNEKLNTEVYAALNEAVYLINEIRNINLKHLTSDSNDTLRYCSTMHSNVQSMENSQPTLNNMENDLNTIMDKINDMYSLIKRIMSNIDQVNELSMSNKRRKERVIDLIQQIIKMNENLSKIRDGQVHAVEEIQDFLQTAKRNLHYLKINDNYLKNLSRLVEEEAEVLLKLNKPYEEKYVRPAMDHAQYLWNKAQAYANLFVNVKHDADVALRASKAYQNIVDAIADAKLATSNASFLIDNTFREYYSDVTKGLLLDESKYSQEKSRRLKIGAEYQVTEIEKLQKQLQNLLNLIYSVRSTVSRNEEAVNLILQQLNKTASDRTYNVLIKKSEDLSSTLARIRRNNTVLQIETTLRPKLTELQNKEDINLNLINSKIKKSEVNNKEVIGKLDHARERSKEQREKFQAQNLTAADQFDALRNKIIQTRHVIEAMQLSMTSSDAGSGRCTRSYQLETLEPSTVNTIVITYAINTNHRDALLFFLQSSTSKDYIAIEMVNRKIRFVWDLGGGPGEITHPHHIQTAGDLHKDQHWYRIEAERTFNVGKLAVRPVVLPIGSPLINGSPVTNNSASGWGQFDTNADDRIWIGGINVSSDSKPHLLYSKQNNLVGCLHRVLLDDKRIGLWNFKSELSPGACVACVEGAEEHQDDGFYTFSGDGYSVLHNGGSFVYNRYIFSVTLNFKTYDEQAVLFYAASNNPDQYILLTIEHGLVVLRIGYSVDLMLELKTIARYNNGNWTHVEATRYFDKKKRIEKAILKTSSESKEGIPSPPPSQNEIPDLSEPQYFIGGLPPGFKTSLQLPRSFLGCISDIQINQEGFNPLRGHYSGVSPRCSDKPLTVVGFHGNGYMELHSYPMKKKSSFSFTFATLQQDAFLMLTTTEGLSATIDPSYMDENETSNIINFERSSVQNYYSVSLRRGQIDVRLNAGFGELRLATDNAEYGDGVFHSLSVIKSGKKVELRVDDIVQATAYMPEGYSNIKAPGKAGGLFFGGIPSDISVTSTVVSEVPLIGTVKNAIFNDQLIAFDNPIEFEHADIGRPGIVPVTNQYGRVAAAMHRRDTNVNSAGCFRSQSYTVQQGAVRFGDIPFSHVLIDFQKQTLMHKNFTIDLKFRTFYPNGLLFLIPGIQNRSAHYLLAFLRSGRITVIVKGKRRSEISTQAVFNDGIWHRMKVMRNGKILSLHADDVPPVKVSVPRKLGIANTMYIGGVPDNATLLEILLQKTEPIKGCIEDVYIDGKKEDLVGEKVIHHKVGQCFPQIERGAYFPGDAYAMFKKNFYIGSLLELELEFRTSEKSGMLLSVSEPDGYPALSLEFNHGRVILSGDMGDRRPFKIEHVFPSEYAICDNKWHTIQAYYVNEELTLRVDSVDQKYWLSDNGHLTEAHTNSPLYIGGLPDNASSGTLQTKENFRGCMRNVVIGGEKCDWTSVPVVHNVLFSSCPSPTS